MRRRPTVRGAALAAPIALATKKLLNGCVVHGRDRERDCDQGQNDDDQELYPRGYFHPTSRSSGFVERAVSHSSITRTISLSDQSCCVTPAAIAGVIRRL